MTISYSEMTKRRKGIITTTATKFKDAEGNVYDKNEIIETYMLPSCSRASLHKQINGEPFYKYNKVHYWLNKCPGCGRKGTLTLNPKNTFEGELTCRPEGKRSLCDMDWCGVCGYEKIEGSTKHLTEVFPIENDNTSPPTPTDTTTTTTDTTITTDTTTDPSGEVVDDTVTITDSNEKTITQQVIDETYTKAYFQEIQALKTDKNGVFKHKIKLPYNGKYNINVHYGGSRLYSPSTVNFKIDNKGIANFTPVLLERITTTTYSDNSNDINKEGDAKNNHHTYTKRTIINYSEGVEKSRSTEIIQNDTQTKSIISNNDISTAPTTPPTPTTPISPTLTGRYDPFSTDISLTERGTPNVEVMGNATYNYKWYSNTATYTLLKEHYTEVMHRDSVCLQLNNYKDSKFTAFRTKEEPNTFHVIHREAWNSVEETLLRYLVLGNGIPYPDEIKVDFNRKITTINGKEIKFKNQTTGNIVNFVVRDQQNTSYTCGPTASSVCSQVLHNYYSESKMQSVIRASGSSGSEHGDITRGLKELGFSVEITYNWNKVVDHLSTRRPVVYHKPGHYKAAIAISNDKNKIYMINSSGNANYSPKNGWTAISGPKREFAYESGRQSVLVSLNYNVSDKDKQKFNHFYSSMGGAWTRPEVQEKIADAHQGLNAFL